MANNGPNTNGSQFFFSYAAQPHLDLKYTIFGKLVLLFFKNYLQIDYLCKLFLKLITCIHLIYFSKYKPTVFLYIMGYQCNYLSLIFGNTILMELILNGTLYLILLFKYCDVYPIYFPEQFLQSMHSIVQTILDNIPLLFLFF